MDKVGGAVEPVDTRHVEANKAFTMLGHSYSPGDPVDVSSLPDHKVSQLLNQRFLRPVKGVGDGDTVS